MTGRKSSRKGAADDDTTVAAEVEDQPSEVPAGDAEPTPPGDDESQPREVTLDPSYVSRPYSEAMTDEQRAVLEAEDLLPVEEVDGDE